MASPKKYRWEVFKIGSRGLENTRFILSYMSGGTTRSAFNDFNSYIAERLEDGYYLVVRLDKKYFFRAEVWR